MSEKAEIFDKVPETDYVEAALDTNPEEFERVVRSRRSTRVFTDEPVPEDVMHRCLDLAMLAPNSSNLQPWEFHWVRTPEKRAELVRYCLSQPTARTASELVVCVARLDTWRRNRQWMLDHFAASGTGVPESAIQYYEKIVPLAYTQGPFYLFGPVKKFLMWCIARTKPSPRGPAGKADMRVWAHKSAALACQNLMLSLRAHGYDSCPMEGMDGTRVRKLLGLPRSAEVCMVVSAGKRADNGIYGPRIRFDRDRFVYEV